MTKVLIDSSAWIHFFRKKEGWYESVSEFIEKDAAVTCGLIITEIMRGARNPKEKAQLKENLTLLDYYNLYPDYYYEAAELGSTLASKGFILKTIDLLIAQIALKNKILLLHDDSDFEFIAKHSSLKTLTK